MKIIINLNCNELNEIIIIDESNCNIQFKDLVIKFNLPFIVTIDVLSELYNAYRCAIVVASFKLYK